MNNGERYGLPHPVMMPSLDRSLSALLEDMDQRGLLAETLLYHRNGKDSTVEQVAGT